MADLHIKDWYMLHMMDFDMDPMDLAKELKIFPEKRRMYDLLKGETPPNLYGTDKPVKSEKPVKRHRSLGGRIGDGGYSEAIEKSKKLNKDRWWED